MNLYSDDFQRTISPTSRQSASIVVPILKGLFHPASVIDLGCGYGNWLAEWIANGVVDVLGVDGPYVDARRVALPADSFRSWDLSQSFTAPRRYDLAMTLEVAEHLPEERAESFVSDLCSLADVVVFGAATPWQGGVGHVNCQWPSYWASLFARHGYGALDCLRPLIWDDRQVEWWYRQNTIVFLRGNQATERSLDLVHPEFLHHSLFAREVESPRQIVPRLTRAVRRSLQHRLGRTPDTPDPHAPR